MATVSARPAASVPPAVVTAILVVHDGQRWLVDTLDAIALQTRAPDRLLIVDAGSADNTPKIIEQHAAVRAHLDTVEVLTLGADASLRDCVTEAVATLPGTEDTSEWLWLLHDDTAPAPEALSRMLDVARRSSGVAIVGPKLATWDDPKRLIEVGHQLTRAGRRAGGPVIGEPDQGQYDDRTDVLGVRAGGMLVRRHLFTALGGFEKAFPGGGEGLDLSWRAHLAGHRVLVAPRAVVAEAGASLSGAGAGSPKPASVRRRLRLRARQVALTRASLLALPFMALWVALGAVASAAVLLVLKRPRRAWEELTDLGAVLTPWRGLAARWRFRGRRTVRRRDLRGLFVPGKVARRSALDGFGDAVTLGGARRGRRAVDGSELETGPVGEDAEALGHLPATWPQRVVRHPGFLAVLLTTVLTVVFWRGLITGDAVDGGGHGLAGGQLFVLDTDGRGLWHAWRDGWTGDGLGQASSAGPWVVVLAGLGWLTGLLPWVDPGTSPAGTAIAWLLVLAMPLSAWSAYLGTRVTTRSKWPRAVAALAWASLAVLTTAIASGRLGLVVAHILLPLVVAGFILAARRHGSGAATFGTVLAIAVTGAFAPALLALSTLASLLVLVFAPGWARLRGLVLAIVPLVLLAPWTLRAWEDPRLLLSGPGLASVGVGSVQPWELALLHPGGPGSYPVLLTAPFALAAVLGLLRRGRASAPVTWLALLALLGLAGALAADRVHFGTVPAGRPGAGAEITLWAGVPLSVLAVALLMAAAYGAAAVGTRSRWSGLGRLRWLVAPVAAAAVVGVLASAGWAAWEGVGQRLQPATPARPAVVVEQSAGPTATRLLELVPTDGAADEVGYALRGEEPGRIARELPRTPAAVPRAPEQAVRAILDAQTDAELEPDTAHRRLAELAVGFVGLRAEPDHPIARQLDSTQGLARLSDSQGLVLWRVAPQPGTDPADPVGPARARVTDADDTPVTGLAVEGPHAALRTQLEAGSPGRQLVLSEGSGWIQHASVRFDGDPLEATSAAPWPTYALPSTAGELTVDVLPREGPWHLVQGIALALVVFLAVPFGTRRSRRRS